MAISTKTTENVALLAELPWYIKKLLPSSLRHALDNNNSHASERNVCAIYCAWLNNRWYLDIVFRLFNIYDQFYSNDVIKSLTALEKYGELTEKNSRRIDKASFEAIIGLDEPLQHIEPYTELLDSLRVNQPVEEFFTYIRPIFIPTPGGQVNEQVKHVLNKFKEHNLLSERQGQTNLKRLAPILLNLENFFEREDFWALFKEQETAQTNFELLVFWITKHKKDINSINDHMAALIALNQHKLLAPNMQAPIYKILMTQEIDLIEQANFFISIADLLLMVQDNSIYELMATHQSLSKLIVLTTIMQHLDLLPNDQVGNNNFKHIATAKNTDHLFDFVCRFQHVFEESNNRQELFNTIMSNPDLFKYLNVIQILNDLPPRLVNQNLLDDLVTIIAGTENDEREEQLGTYLQTRFFQFALDAFIGENDIPHLEQNPDPFNNAQSTHTASVNKSASESAKKLWEAYGADIARKDLLDGKLNELSLWANNLFERPDEYKQNIIYLTTLKENPNNIAQDDLKNLLGNNYYGYVLFDEYIYFIDLADDTVKHTYFKTDVNNRSLFPSVDAPSHIATEDDLKNIHCWIDFAPSAKRFVKSITTLSSSDARYHYREPASGISLQQILALVWIAIHDPTKLTCTFDRAKALVIEGYYEAQRGYNLNEQGLDNGREDNPICVAGIFNKQMEKLASIHQLVSMKIITKESLGLKIPVVINKAVRKYVKTMSDNPNDSSLNILTTLLKDKCAESIWEFIQKEIKDSLFDEYGSLFPNEVEFNEYIDAGGKDVDFNEKTIEKLDEAIASLSDNANNVSLSA